MNRDDIIRMARDAGFATGTRDLADGIGAIQTVWPVGVETCLPTLERFAALVAAAEREACAKECDTAERRWFHNTPMSIAARQCAAAIRARGELV